MDSKRVLFCVLHFHFFCVRMLGHTTSSDKRPNLKSAVEISRSSAVHFKRFSQFSTGACLSDLSTKAQGSQGE
jgi:hypothetical protein